MTGINDDDIAPGGPKDTAIFDDQITEAIQRVEREKTRLLAVAFVRGYDGVDIQFEPKIDWKTTYHAFQSGLEFTAWVGDPPDTGIAPRGIQRYDFRRLNKHQKRELASYVGVTDLNDIPEMPQEDSDA